MRCSEALVPRTDTPDTWTVFAYERPVGMVTRYRLTGAGRGQFRWGTGEPGLQNPTFPTLGEALATLGC